MMLHEFQIMEFGRARLHPQRRERKGRKKKKGCKIAVSAVAQFNKVIKRLSCP